MQSTNNRLIHLLVCVLVLLLPGCREVEPTIMYQLRLSEYSVVYDMNGSEKSISVSPFPEDMEWEAAYSLQENWFSFEVHEKSLTVRTDPNYSLESRTGGIIITSPEGLFEPIEVSVVQESAEPMYFSTTAKDYDFDSEGGEAVFTVQSNYDWTLEYDASWLTVFHEAANDRMIIECQPNESEEERSEILTLYAGAGELEEVYTIVITQGTRAENPYYKLLGQWEITAAKWFYSPNGSLNSLDYTPSPTEYNLIFDIEQGEYGKSYLMKNFLYPGTSLEIGYDKDSGNIVIPFGWTVYSYDVFLYLTLVSSTSFSYASLEVDGVPSDDYTSISLDLPSVSGFNYVGFGLWTYNDNGNKVALGSRSYPTMFPMGPIVFKKYSI